MSDPILDSVTQLEHDLAALDQQRSDLVAAIQALRRLRPSESARRVPKARKAKRPPRAKRTARPAKKKKPRPAPAPAPPPVAPPRLTYPIGARKPRRYVKRDDPKPEEHEDEDEDEDAPPDREPLDLPPARVAPVIPTHVTGAARDRDRLVLDLVRKSGIGLTSAGLAATVRRAPDTTEEQHRAAIANSLTRLRLRGYVRPDEGLWKPVQA